MRWSLLMLGVFLVLSLTLNPSVDGARVRRDEGKSNSILEKLFNAIMGVDDDGDGGGDDDDDEHLTSTSTSTLISTTTATTTTTVEEPFTNGTANEAYNSTEASSTTLNQTTESPSTTMSPECQRPNDLAGYCTLSDAFGYYMQWDTRSDRLVSKVFSDTVINQLLTMCQPGSWCLGNDFIESFSRNMIPFFNSPICDAGLEGCIDNVLSRRAQCPDVLKLSVLSDALSLLCEMTKITGEITPECFGHTIATLHVTMADEIRAVSKEIQFGEEFCLGAYVGMTRKFMCTLEECPSHQKLFRDFPPWQWFINDEVAIKEYCQLDHVCGDKELEEEERTTLASTAVSTGPTDSTETPPQETVQETTKEEPTPQNDKPVFILQYSDDSTRLLIGVITGSLIGVLVIMLLIGALVKRMRKKYRFSTKDGYSKLHNEDFD